MAGQMALRLSCPSWLPFGQFVRICRRVLAWSPMLTIRRFVRLCCAYQRGSLERCHRCPMGNRTSRVHYFPHDSDHPQVGSIAISGVLGVGVSPPSKFPVIAHPSHLSCTSAINIALAFCMGTDIEYLLSSPIGQPMAQIFFNSFGERGTLALWSFVVAAQYVSSAIPYMSLLITLPLGT